MKKHFRLWRLLFPVIILLFLCACSGEGAEKSSANDIPSPDELSDRNPDIGVGVWGDSPETVEALCENGEWAFVRTSDNFAGYDTILEYYFNDKGLYAGQHDIMGTEPREEKYLSIKETLVSQYGEPSSERYFTGNQSETLASFEEVLEKNGRVEANWRLSDDGHSYLMLSMMPDGHVLVYIYTM